MWSKLSSECVANCLGASFLLGELSWGELSLGRVVLFPSFDTGIRAILHRRGSQSGTAHRDSKTPGPVPALRIRGYIITCPVPNPRHFHNGNLTVASIHQVQLIIISKYVYT